MLNISVSSGASRAELIAAHSALSILINPSFAASYFDGSSSLNIVKVDASTPAVPVNPTATSADPGSDSDPGDEQPGLDAEGKPKRIRRTKAQIEADRISALAAANPAPATHGTVSSADLTAPLDPPFQGAPQPAATPTPSAADSLFGDSFPAVAAPVAQPATLADLQGLVNELLAIDAAKGMAAAMKAANDLGVGSFKALDPSKYNDAAAALRTSVSSLKVAA